MPVPVEQIADRSLMPFIWPSTIKAINACKRANEQEDYRDFEEAIKYYKESEGHLIYAIENDATTEECKATLRNKRQEVQNRVEQLNQYLERQKYNKKKNELLLKY